MYKLIELRKEVEDIVISEEAYLELSNKGLFLNGNKIKSDVDSYSFRLSENGIIVYQFGEDAYLGDTCLEKSALLKNSVNGNIAIIYSNLDFNTWEANFTYYDISQAIKLFDIGYFKFSDIHSFEGYTIFRFEKAILCYSIKNQDNIHKLWETEYNHDLTATLGLINNKLIIACAEKSHQVLAIDIHTGDIIRVFSEVPNLAISTTYVNVIPKPPLIQIDYANNQLVELYNKYLIEIEIDSGKAVSTDLSQELERNGLSSFNTAITDIDNPNLIYGMSDYEKPNTNRLYKALVVLNKSTKKIVWFFPFTESSMGNNIPVIHKDKIFIRDTNDKLYIFQKTIEKA